MNSGYLLYILFSLPALILGFWAQYKVKSSFSKYSKVRSIVGLSGSQIARKMLDSSGLTHVGVEEVSGFLSDHYDPTKKVLRLSQQVFRSNSLAAAGIAAHEAGHALQDSIGYVPLKFRSAMVPSVQVGSWLGPIIFMVGLMIAGSVGGTIAWVGLFLFAATAIFALVTLPVEFAASRRARAFLTESGVIYQEEINGVRSVLDGAALTYVAAAIQAISTIMYYAYLLLGRRRD